MATYAANCIMWYYINKRSFPGESGKIWLLNSVILSCFSLPLFPVFAAVELFGKWIAKIISIFGLVSANPEIDADILRSPIKRIHRNSIMMALMIIFSAPIYALYAVVFLYFKHKMPNA